MTDASPRRRLETLWPPAAAADHVDVKSVEGRGSLRAFLARALSYQPGWYRALFRLRGLLARLLGLRHEDVAAHGPLGPQGVPFTPGQTALFFTVRAAREEVFWIAGAGDRHLEAELAVFCDELGGGRRRFHLATVVRYKNALGPLYFNLIRPFHHLIVAAMARHAVRDGQDA